MDIYSIIDNIHSLPWTSKEKLLGIMRKVEYPKGYCLLHEHKKGQYSYIIIKGVAHAFTEKDGRRATFWIGKEGDIIYPAQTYFDNKGEYGTAELLEDCVLYEIDTQRLHQFYQEDVHLANWGRRYAEQTCIRLEKFFIARHFMTAMERYQKLMDEYPDILLRVPLHIIASFLDTSQVNLSRIRARKTTSNLTF